MNTQWLQQRPVWLGLMSLALLTLAGVLYKVVLEKPLGQAAQLERRYQSEQQNLSTAGAMDTLEHAVRDLEQRAETLQDQTSLRVDARDADAIVPEVVRLLDTLSLRHNVRLESVVPLPERQIEEFLELPFNVAIVGRYPDLYHWLTEAEELLNPMTVNRFTVSTAGEGGSVSMQLQLASYRMDAS